MLDEPREPNISAAAPASIPAPPEFGQAFILAAIANGTMLTVDVGGATGAQMLVYDHRRMIGAHCAIAYATWTVIAPCTAGELTRRALGDAAGVFLSKTSSNALNAWINRVSSPHPAKQAPAPAEGEAA